MQIDQYPVVYEGSVKKIREVEACTEDAMGLAIFEFTDDSSVKDYGKLPFTTPHKGQDLCQMAVQGFEDLAKMGIPTIFREQLSENAILVDYVRVLDPKKTDLKEVRHNRLVPLECIIRNVITKTSSACKRLQEGSLGYQELGLKEMPSQFPCVLPKMFFDGSTKLGITDEYMSWEELKTLSTESTFLLNEIEVMSRMIGLYALTKGAQAGLIIHDYKLEWALDVEGDLILADVPLAIDEITSAYVGHSYQDLDEFRNGLKVFVPGVEHGDDSMINLSKQIYRDHYQCAHPDWVEELNECKAKKVSKDKYPAPPAPPEELIQISSDLFGGLRNIWCSQNQREAPELEVSCKAYREFAKKFYKLEES